MNNLCHIVFQICHWHLKVGPNMAQALLQGFLFSLVPDATALGMPYSKISLEHKTVINELDLTVVNPDIDMLPFEAQVKIASMGIEKDE